MWNYLIYDGEQRVHPEDLQEKDATEVIAWNHTNGKLLSRQRFRDLKKMGYDSQPIYNFLNI